MTKTIERPRIYVLAGVNGAGKSSVGGAMFRRAGVSYFNPDEVAKELRDRYPQLSQAEANSSAWHRGKALLERAIEERLNFAFETTLGGNTITSLLSEAIRQNIDVFVWFAGLETAELHIDRVAARVRRGGHPIPERDIRKRWTQSRLNLIRLLPGLAEVRLFDNSEDGDPGVNELPKPRLILHWCDRKMVGGVDMSDVPDWAKPILAEAIRQSR